MKKKENKVVHSGFWANIFAYDTEETDLRKSLHTVPLFSSLSKRDISLLISIIHNRNYIAGEYIFYQGDPGIGLYIIREGMVEIFREDNEINRVKLATFKKDDFFGELALVDGEKRSASAIAKTNTRVAVIFKPDLDELIAKYPKKGVKILYGISKIIALRLRVLNEEYFKLQGKLKYTGG